MPHKLWAEQEKCIYAPKFLNEHKEFDLILCGDCHRQFLFYSADEKRRIICNTGCMTRYVADEYNLTYKPGFYVYNTDTRSIKWNEIPHQPAEEVLSRKHIERKKEINQSLNDFIDAVGDSKLKTKLEGVDFDENLLFVLEKENISDSVRDILAETMDEELK